MMIGPGTKLGSYEVLERLGSGGMGVVYKARDSRLGRTVAVKLLPPERTRDDHAKQRFLHEARAASALDHANICTIHEIDETDEGQLYLVMALYEGETLATRIERGPVDMRDTVDILMQVSAGLAEAHAAGIVHRDIKPANLLVTRSGVVKILDFGLAKLAGGEIATQTGTISGTVAYMSPEQAQGHELDHRTDIWSLGVVLFEMLVGRRPFRGDNLLALSRAIAHDPHEIVSRARTDVAVEFDRILARMLAKRPGDRYQHLVDVVTDLAELATVLGLDARAPIGLKPPASAGAAADRPRSSSGTAGTRLPPSIAVLPFADMSPQKDQDYFCEGMAEELINALTAIEGLHVAARTSSFQFRGQSTDVSEIGRRLRVATILAGSVRKAGNRLRITAQLVKASDGFHLWSERYDREMDDIFAVQDEIARSVVDKLRVRLLTGVAVPLVKRHTDNVAAYHAFLRGRHCRFSLYDLRGAIGFFEEAVQLDPTYALAHAALADCFNTLGLYGVLAPQAAAAKAKSAVEHALTFDADLPEAVGVLGRKAFYFDWDWVEVDRLLSRAVALRPSGVEIYCWYGYFLATMGRAEEGQEQSRYAASLDPLSAYVLANSATMLYVGRRYDDAVRLCEQALEIQPGFGFALNTLTVSHAGAGRYDQAIAAGEQLVAVSNRSSHSLGVLGSALASAGRPDAARALLTELDGRRGSGYVSPLADAEILGKLGEFDRAFARIDESCQLRAATVHSLWFPQFDSLRADARYDALLRRLQLPPYSPWASASASAP